METDVTQPTTPTLRDRPDGYGAISRSFHWMMALLFAWQFVGACLHALNRDWAVSAFFWGTHRDLGFLLLVLVLLRGAWGLANAARRPHHHGLVGRLASLGHLGLYGLMVFVPTVALLRQFGSGRPFSPFGIPLMAGGGEKVGWMTALGNASHSLTAWALLALVAGHVFMVFVHHFAWKDDTARMMIRGAR